MFPNMKYNPYDYAVIDIETLDVDEESLALEESLLKPNGACKYEKSKKESLQKKKAELYEKAALQNTSPIGCIGVKSYSQMVIFCNFPLSASDIAILFNMGIQAIPFENEHSMLVGFRDGMECLFTPETAMVTWNGDYFDFRKMRLAFSRHALRQPFTFRNFHRDLKVWYANEYSLKSDKFPALGEAVKTLGLGQGKIMEGAMFPCLIQWGHETGNSIYFILAVVYNAYDLRLEESVYWHLHPDIGN